MSFIRNCESIQKMELFLMSDKRYFMIALLYMIKYMIDYTF